MTKKKEQVEIVASNVTRHTEPTARPAEPAFGGGEPPSVPGATMSYPSENVSWELMLEREIAKAELAAERRTNDLMRDAMLAHSKELLAQQKAHSSTLMELLRTPSQQVSSSPQIDYLRASPSSNVPPRVSEPAPEVWGVKTNRNEW